MTPKPRQAKLRQWLRRLRQWLLGLLRKPGDAWIIDLSDILYFGGIVLVGVGAYQHDVGAGLIVTGVLMLLTVKPLLHWLK